MSLYEVAPNVRLALRFQGNSIAAQRWQAITLAAPSRFVDAAFADGHVPLLHGSALLPPRGRGGARRQASSPRRGEEGPIAQRWEGEGARAPVSDTGEAAPPPPLLDPLPGGERKRAVPAGRSQVYPGPGAMPTGD